MAPREYIPPQIEVLNNINDLIEVDVGSSEDSEALQQIIEQSLRIRGVLDAIESNTLHCDEYMYSSSEYSEDFDISSDEMVFTSEDEQTEFETRVGYSFWSLNGQFYCVYCAEICGIINHPEAAFTVVNRTLYSDVELRNYIQNETPNCVNFSMIENMLYFL